MHKRINQNDYFLSRPFLTCPVVYCMQYLRVQYRCVQLKTYFESFFKYCLCLLGLLQRSQEGPKLDVVENLIKIQITQFLGVQQLIKLRGYLPVGIPGREQGLFVCQGNIIQPVEGQTIGVIVGWVRTHQGWPVGGSV